MSNKFCVQCNNLLWPLTYTNTLQFQCNQCNKSFPAEPADTRLAVYSKHSEHSQYNDLIKGSGYDPTIKRVNDKCKVCGKYKGLLRLGENEKTVYVCECTSASSITTTIADDNEPAVLESVDSKNK